MGCHILCACYTCATWTVTGTVWTTTSSVWTVFHPLCGLPQPLCGVSLAKRGNEDNVLYGGYRAFANVQRTCPSLTTRAQVGLRFDPPLETTYNNHKERRKVTNTGNDDKEEIKKETGNADWERTQVTKTGNEDGERRQGIGNKKRNR